MSSPHVIVARVPELVGNLYEVSRIARKLAGSTAETFSGIAR